MSINELVAFGFGLVAGVVAITGWQWSARNVH